MDHTNSPEISTPPLRILSLDGGGIRGISSLLILEDVMEKIREAQGLERVPRPCEHFDLIGGTSTGGIIAIMLGRLGMTVDECIRAYRKVAQQAFTAKRTSIFPAPPTGAFSAKALEAAIKQTVRDFCVESECVTRRCRGHQAVETCPHSEMAFRDGSCTKTVVLAITKDNIDAMPTLFKTYDTSTGFDGCTIWQVARATSAATTFFKSIKVGRDEIEFVDAGFGYNNPCEVLIEEAQRQFPRLGKVRVLSIGTGLGEVVSIDNTRLSILNALKKMATSSKKVAASMDSRYGDSGQYSRFNVDQGLQDIRLSDWEKASKISAHTRNYLSENQRAVWRFVNGFSCMSRAGDRYDEPSQRSTAIDGDGAGSQELLPTTYYVETQSAAVGAELSGAPSNRVHYFVPFPENKRFVGRQTVLNTLEQMLFIQKEQKVALVGLGGIGKTQVALQFAYWTKKNRPEYSVFWVPALSKGSFEQAYTEIAKVLAIGKSTEIENIKESVRRYLSSLRAGLWLLVVDNADDMDMLFEASDTLDSISEYLPESENGVILFTTRSREVAGSVAGSNMVELQEMDPKEATSFLEKSLFQKDLLRDDAATAELLTELTHLPLAITQAAAYLNRNQVSIADYLGLLRGTEQDMIGLMSRSFRDSTRYRGSQNAVATTWLVSFDQIRESDSAAADLLSFISCIEPKAIPRSILPGSQPEEQVVHAIGTLCMYSFMVRRGESKIFDMHSLVHLATRIWVQKHALTVQTTEKAIRHLAIAFPSDYYANRNLWRDYLPHALRALQGREGRDMEEKCYLYILVGRCLRADGRIKDAVKCIEESYRWRKGHFPEDHPDQLASQHMLAIAYHEDEQVKKAIELLEHVVGVRGKTLAEDHPDRLASQQVLAMAYHTDVQVKKAVELLEHVVAVQEKTLAEVHPGRLASQHTLAIVYHTDGQVKKAVELLEHVVAVREKTLAEDHPHRLASQQVLARAYRVIGQVKKAVQLLEHVIAVEGKTLAEDHPDRLASQHELAIAYHTDGQVKKAVELLEHVVTVQGKTLAEDHPNRLASQHELAMTYRTDGQVKKAVELLEHVVTVQRKTLAEDHPDRLASQHALAIVYKADR